MAVPPTNTATTTPNSATQKAANASQQVSPDIQQKQTVTASTTTPKATSDLDAVLLPVKLQQPKTTVSTDLDITIQNQQYQLTKTAELQKLLQQTAQVVMTSEQVKAVTKAANLAFTQESNTTQPTNSSQQFAPAVTTNQPTVSVISTQLVLLAQSINLTLPTSLTELAQQNGVSTQQLTSLASRPQGYTLPTAQVSQGLLTFTDGPSIKLPQTVVLSEGQYLAKVVVNQQQLQLALTPVVAKVNVDLVKQAAVMPNLQANNVVLTKNEPAQILSQFIKKLEATPLPSTSTPKTTVNQSKPATGSSGTSDVVNSAQQGSRNSASMMTNTLSSRPNTGLGIGVTSLEGNTTKDIPMNLSTAVTTPSSGIKTNNGNVQQGVQHQAPLDVANHTQKVPGQQLTANLTSASIPSSSTPATQNIQATSAAQVTQTTQNTQATSATQVTQTTQNTQATSATQVTQTTQNTQATSAAQPPKQRNTMLPR
ncbi:hypothetical protein [Shewanella phaeophyticola]|uniref:Flagellar hook-length control protein FliK n=1 Tax=Shewanella phaeophyticola TaxID=2978345 RepID=A0ABT2NZJ6_9GAMM|nr:hypothetical protein [Shewanella sp. KJ10-1]MCT8985814.1 hypothetical protein [Shewanella sp. KJ10-1]